MSILTDAGLGEHLAGDCAAHGAARNLISRPEHGQSFQL